MAAGFKLCLTILLVVIQLSIVSSRHDYYHYYSRYQKGSSTAESTALTSDSEGTSNDDGQTMLQYGDVYDSERTSNNDGQAELKYGDVYAESSIPRFKERVMATSTIIAIVMGVVIGALTLICCIGLCCMCCCGCCGNSTERKGFVFRSNVPIGQEPAAVAQYISPEDPNLPQYPPPYDTQPVQQPQHFQYQSVQEPFQQPPMPHEYQYPPTQQPPENIGYQNQPSAPPPYFDKY